MAKRETVVKSKASCKGKKKPKSKVTESNEEKPAANKLEVSQAIKVFIYENMNKLAIKEIAEACGLTEAQVEEVATSSELDNKPVSDDGTVQQIRRYQSYKGAVAMTPAQSMLNDRLRAKNLPSQEEINKAFGKDFEKIKVNKPSDDKQN